MSTNKYTGNFEYFKNCEGNTSDTKAALGCCISECNGGIDCQEQCIDAYNSLIRVDESFFATNRKLLFLLFVIAFHSALILEYISLPADKTKSIVYIIIIYSILYYVTFL